MPADTSPRPLLPGIALWLMGAGTIGFFSRWPAALSLGLLAIGALLLALAFVRGVLALMGD